MVIDSSAIVAVLLVGVGTIGGTIWFVAGLRAGLPDDDAISRMGVMDQATSVFDLHDELAFTETCFAGNAKQYLVYWKN